MSIRHCIAGVVLVVTGGLAVNAYQFQPFGTKAEESLPRDVALAREITNYEAQLVDLQWRQRQLAAQTVTVEVVLKALRRERDRPMDEDKTKKTGSVLVAPNESVVAAATTSALTTDTLVLADDPQPAPKAEVVQDQYSTDVVYEAGPRRSGAAMTSESATATPSASPVGRYQFVDRVLPDGNKAGLMYDTTTGHCWSLIGSEWKDLGLPMQPVAKSYYYGNPTPRSWEDRATGGPPANAANTPSPDLTIKPVPSPVDAGKVPTPIRGEPVLDTVKPATPAPGEVFKKRGVE